MLMTGKVVNQYASTPDELAMAAADNKTMTNQTLYSPTEVATVVCFMAGFWSVSYNNYEIHKS